MASGLESTTIGRKDTRITISSRTSTNDPVTNEPEYTYATLATVWAEELGPLSSEKYEADQQVAVNIVRFRVRSSETLRTSLDETCRVTRGTDTFEISRIEKIGRNVELVLTCEMRDNG